MPHVSSAHPPGAASPEGIVPVAEERTPYAVAARELLRSTLFDAARDELASRRWSEVTMADIAAAAGVSRQTLYKEFGSREQFARALILREADRFISTVEEAMDAHLGDPKAALLAAFGLFLAVAAEDPLVRAAIAGADEMLPLVTTQGQPLVERSTERLHAAIISRWPQVSPHDAALLAECLVRLAISYATLPAGPAGMTASSIAELLGPYIEGALQAESTARSAGRLAGSSARSASGWG
jgi:AcrR family transcriptional regulator